MTLAHRLRFMTPEGINVAAVTAAEMTMLLHAAQESGLSPLQLLENAGRSVAEFAIERAGSGALPRVLVLAGPTSNGACGICAARHMANHGLAVRLIVSELGRCSPITADQLAAFRETCGREVRPGQLDEQTPELVVDAMSGFAELGATSHGAVRAIEWMNDADADIVALDVPSGLNPTTGLAQGPAVLPHVTLSMGLPYVGLQEANAGELVLVDVGIPERAFHRAGIPYASPFERRYRVNLTPR